jgi:hypothetical protein
MRFIQAVIEKLHIFFKDILQSSIRQDQRLVSLKQPETDHCSGSG